MLKRIFNPNPPNNFNTGGYYMPNYDFTRIETEINEMKRVINELSKRISRLENYLGVQSRENLY